MIQIVNLFILNILIIQYTHALQLSSFFTKKNYEHCLLSFQLTQTISHVSQILCAGCIVVYFTSFKDCRLDHELSMLHLIIKCPLTSWPYCKEVKGTNSLTEWATCKGREEVSLYTSSWTRNTKESSLLTNKKVLLVALIVLKPTNAAWVCTEPASIWTKIKYSDIWLNMKDNVVSLLRLVDNPPGFIFAT